MDEEEHKHGQKRKRKKENDPIDDDSIAESDLFDRDNDVVIFDVFKYESDLKHRNTSFSEEVKKEMSAYEPGTTAETIRTVTEKFVNDVVRVQQKYQLSLDRYDRKIAPKQSNKILINARDRSHEKKRRKRGEGKEKDDQTIAAVPIVARNEPEPEPRTENK